MKKKWIIGLIVILLVAGAVFVFTQYLARGRAAAGEIRTARLGRGPLQVIVGASGTVRSRQTAQLTWQTTGTIGDINISLGDQVNAGQILAVLEQTSLPQNIILARVDFVNAQRALEDLRQSDLARVQALQALETAQRAMDDLEGKTAAKRADANLALLQAQKAFDEAQRKRNNLNYARASEGMVNAAEARYILAQNEVDEAQDRYNELSGLSEDDPRRALALANLADKQTARDVALRQLNWYKGHPSEKDLADADAELEQARATLAEAQRDWDRIKDGVDPTEKALLEAQLEEAQRDYERVKSGYDPKDEAAAEARLDASEATLELAQLKAPFTGTLTRIANLPGDHVSPGTFGFQIDDLSSLLVDIRVSEIDINQVKVGQEASLTFDAILGKEYKGKVFEVAKVGTSSQGVVDFEVTLELSDPDQDVKPGMTAAVNIVVDQLEDVLLVPNRAVRSEGGKRVVYVMRDGVPTQVEIRLGSSSETESQVLGGDIHEGDQIVLNMPTNFFEGGPGQPGGFGGGGNNNSGGGGTQ